MVSPMNLLRSDSNGAQRFSAPVENDPNERACGVKTSSCLAELLNLKKLAKFWFFFVVLLAMGCVQGIIATYFKGASQLWTSYYNFPVLVKIFILVSNQLFVGVLALCISCWGNRIHRATWMGALTMLIAVSGATLAIVEIYEPFTGVEITNFVTGPTVCGNFSTQHKNNISSGMPFNVVTFPVCLTFQLIFGTATISFISYVLTSIADHSSAEHSPALIGAALTAHEIGKQVGICVFWIPHVSTINGTFVSLIWITVTILTCLIGVSMVMFPKFFPNTEQQKPENSRIGIVSGVDPTQDEEFIDDLKNYSREPFIRGSVERTAIRRRNPLKPRKLKVYQTNVAEAKF